jgi:hypothetical protein
MKFNQIIEEAEKNLKFQNFQRFLTQEYKQSSVLTIYTSLKDMERALGPHEEVLENFNGERDEDLDEDSLEPVWVWYINKDTNNPIEIYTDPPYRAKPGSEGTFNHIMSIKREFNTMCSPYDESIIVERLAKALQNAVEFRLWAPSSPHTTRYLKMNHTKYNSGRDNYSILGDDFQGVQKLVEFLKNAPIPQ